ncbi:hypothetical protein D3C85_1383260 [compost metagenome]
MFAVRIVHALVQRHQDGIHFHVLELVEQVDVRAHDQVDVQLAAANLQAHDQLRHGFHRQRIQRTELETLSRKACRLAGYADGLQHILDQLLRPFLQHIGTFQRCQVTPLVLEQRAAQGALKRVNSPVHADVAGVQLGRGLAQVAAAHEYQEHF